MKKIYLSLIACATGGMLLAQTTYMANGPINGQGPLLNTEDSGTSTGWTEFHSYNAGGGASDNSWSAAQPIPFPFEYFGNPVTQFCVSKNFLLTFDVSVAGTTLPASVSADNTSLPNVDLPDSTIAYFWGGFGNAAPIGTNDDVWSKTFGTAPNRQLWIKNFSYEYEGQSYSYNFLVLEETTNNIYMVDARWATQGAGTYTVGLQLDGASAVEHASSPNISSINGNEVNWDPAFIQYYEFIPFIPSTEDAFIASIDAPTLPTCTSLSNVEVTLGTFGINNLTTCNIEWSVNSVAQTPFAWTGNLAQSASESGIVIGSYSFNDGDTLRVWSNLPNGNTDGDMTNDTSTLIVKYGLSGTKLIAASGTGDYLNFTDAVNDIITYGVCGSVIFDVETGVYTEQFTIPEIQGMSAVNNVTFRSQSGDSTDVVIDFNSTGTGDNFVVQFDGGDFFTFEDLTIRNNGTTYMRALVVGGNSIYNTVRNCVIESSNLATSTSTNNALVYSTSGSPSVDSYWLFENNRINGGSYGVYWYGESSTPYQEIGSTFDGNIFENNYYRGARLYYQDSATFVNNHASYDDGYGTGLDVFYFGYCDSSLLVANNYARLDSLYGDALTLYYCEGNPAQHAMVYNNQIIVHAPNLTSTSYGLYSSNADYAKFYHNSVFTNTGSASTRSFYATGGIDNEVINNSLYNAGDGYALYTIGSAVTVSDYNNLYAPSSNVGYFGSPAFNLAAWSAISGLDSNSVSDDPMYLSIDDLHTCGPTLENAGMPGLSIMMDIDGETRSTLMPDIGADEFYAPSLVNLGADTSKCVGQPISMGYPSSNASYTWSNGATTDSITVTAPGIYHLTMNGSCGIAQDTIEIIDIPAPTADFSQQTSFLTAIMTDMSVGADSWSWNFGDGSPVNNQQNPIHVYAAPGTYTISLTVTGPCGSDITVQQFDATTVGMDEESNHFNVSVYPNPTNEVLSLDFKDWSNGAIQVNILDFTGKVILSENLNQAGSFVKVLNVSTLSTGTYMLQLSDNDGNKSTSRFVKL